MNKPLTILDWLTEHFPDAKKTTLRDMVSHHRVTLNGVPVKSLKQSLAPDDKVAVADSTGPTGTIAEGLQIVYQDPDLIIVDKPAGLLTSTHSEEPRPTALAILTEYVQNHNQKAQLHLIHRLDKDASGLLVFARTETAFRKLKAQFEDHSITRHYNALVHGIFRKPTGRLENFLFEDPRGLVHTTKDAKQGKPAILDYLVISATANLTLVRCSLFTGRKHQIRVQLKAVGHPVCGDPIYGTRDAQDAHEPPFRLALHASHLSFVHPKTGKTLSFDSPPPASFSKLVSV